ASRSVPTASRPPSWGFLRRAPRSARRAARPPRTTNPDPTRMRKTVKEARSPRPSLLGHPAQTSGPLPRQLNHLVRTGRREPVRAEVIPRARHQVNVLAQLSESVVATNAEDPSYGVRLVVVVDVMTTPFRLRVTADRASAPLRR